MSEHTPRPWDLDISEYPRSPVITYLGVPVAKAMDNCDTFDETLANARLIATAPELLKACKFALRNHELFMEEYQESD